MLKTDLFFNTFLYKYIYLFSNIHPNIISFFGVLLNISIFFIKKYSLLLFSILNFCRVICDNLDGMVAREFNKCTNLGGYLDSFSDLLHVIILSYFFFIDYFTLFYVYILILIIFLIIFFYLFNLNALSNHNNFYNRKNYNWIDYIPIFISQNTYISIIFSNLFFIIKNMYY